MHKRDEEPESTLPPKAQEQTGSLSEKLSPARARASDQIVKRATHGLIRVESRRRLRAWLRRFLIVAAIVLIGYGCWKWFGDDLPYEWMNWAWEDLTTKIEPLIPAEEPNS